MIVVDGLAFAEGPRWHDGALHLSDMHDHRVLRVDEDGTTTTVLQHDAPVSGIGWLPDGRLLTVVMDGFVLCDCEVLADVRSMAPHGINDMIVHPDGWAYVGQFGYDRHAQPRQPVVPSPLIRVDADGRVSEAAPGLMVANGMAISADGRTLFVAESAGGRVTNFDIASDGSLSNRRLFAQTPPPDGMCIDAEGAAWIAAVTTGAFLRVRDGGEVAQRIDVEEGRHAIACVLGGADRRTLFLLTATTFGEAEPSRQARAARVEAVHVDVPGVGRP